MIYLILSIAFSTLILVIFRLFERYGINTFQAIIYNYVIAFIVGFTLYGDQWNAEHLYKGTWIPYAFIVGGLFISMFLIMGKSAQENGIGITSVAVKMSLLIPVTSAIFLYNESVYWSKIVGIVVGLIGVFLITYQKKTSQKKRSSGNVWFLVILFIGSGLLDTALNYVEKVAAGELSLALFSAIGFGVAAIIGLTILFIRVAHHKIQLQSKALIGGLLLGVPNYFSIYLLLMAIRSPHFSDSITYALNNTGIVVLAFIVGIIAFKEQITWLKMIGGTVSIVAILLLTF